MNAPVPLISAAYAALIGVLAVALGLRVVRLRVRHRIGIGDGGQAELGRAVRVHGNLIETAPLALILLLAAELTQALPPAGLHLVGGALVLGRLLHAFGLGRSSGASGARFAGMVLSWLPTLALAAALLWRVRAG